MPDLQQDIQDTVELAKALGTLVHYREGYRYQLAEETEFHLEQWGLPNFSHFYFHCTDSVLYISKGYAWDGASGPAIDTPSFMRASLVHDVLYQAMREKLLDRVLWREVADDIMKHYCLLDGMNKLRAMYTHWAVRTFADQASRPNRRRVRTVPIARK